jgi:hypothetical protein
LNLDYANEAFNEHERGDIWKGDLDWNKGEEVNSERTLFLPSRFLYGQAPIPPQPPLFAKRRNVADANIPDGEQFELIFKDSELNRTVGRDVNFAKMTPEALRILVQRAVERVQAETRPRRR